MPYLENQATEKSWKILSLLTGGHFWILKCWLIAFLSTLLFSAAPAILLKRQIILPPAYELKSRSPLADTSKLKVPAHEGERSHGAKLTPRLTGSVMLWLTGQFSLNPYLPASLGGLIFLLSGILVAHGITGDRETALFFGLLFAGLYASSACFSINFVPKPFDGVAIGMLGLTLISINLGSITPLAIAAFLSCWGDERAILALVLIAIVVYSCPNFDKRDKIRRCAAIAAAVSAFLISRSLIALMLGWSSADTTMLFPGISSSLSLIQLAAWTAFEGGWIIIACAIWAAFSKSDTRSGIILVTAIVLGLSSSLLVLDVSRGAAFLFPILPASLAIMAGSGAEILSIRKTVAAAAIVSLLSANMEIIIDTTAHFIPSMFFFLLNS